MSDTTTDLLHQIAAALDIDVEEFRAFASVGQGRLATARQQAEMIESFLQLEDSQARQRCISFVQAMVEAEVEATRYGKTG